MSYIRTPSTGQWMYSDTHYHTHHMWTSACHRGAALNCPSLVLPQTCGSCWGLVGLLFLSRLGAQTLSPSLPMFYCRFFFSSHATVDQQSTVPLPVKWGHQWICTGQHNAFGTSGTQRSPEQQHNHRCIIDQDQHCKQ